MIMVYVILTVLLSTQKQVCRLFVSFKKKAQVTSNRVWNNLFAFKSVQRRFYIKSSLQCGECTCTHVCLVSVFTFLYTKVECRGMILSRIRRSVVFVAFSYFLFKCEYLTSWFLLISLISYYGGASKLE